MSSEPAGPRGDADPPALPSTDLARTTLAVTAIAVLLAATLWVLAPFVAALVWAATLVISTWPLLLRVERASGGRRAPAAIAMTIATLAIIVVPLVVGVHALFGLAAGARTLLHELGAVVVPAAPEWVGTLPVVGEQLAAAWGEYAGRQLVALVPYVEPYLRTVGAWFARNAGGLAVTLVQFGLIAVLAGVLYANGEAWARWIRRLAQRIAGKRGDRIVVLAAQSIRGVAMGVVITAVLQTVLAGLGLVVAGVPFAGVLTALMFVFCIAQLGPLLVMLGATAWAFHALGTGWGVALLVWTVIVGTMDNFIRPMLIRRGADLPLLLIIAGVIGGLLAFGVIGIFVGPVVLAVAYTLLDEWVAEGDRSAAGGGTRTESG